MLGPLEEAEMKNRLVPYTWWLKIKRNILVVEFLPEDSSEDQPHTDLPSLKHQFKEEFPYNTWLWKSIGILSIQVKQKAVSPSISLKKNWAETLSLQVIYSEL